MRITTMSRPIQYAVVVAAMAFALLLAIDFAPAGAAQLDPRSPLVVAPQGYTAQPRSKESDRGKRLYGKLKCADCHSIAGIGGVAGPPLDGIGARRAPWFLIGQIADPQRFTEAHPELKSWEPSFMGHVQVSEKEVRSIVAYLLTLSEPEEGFAVGRHAPGTVVEGEAPAGGWTPIPESALSARGRALYFDVGCASCHAIGRYGGMFGPRLDGIGERHSRPYIAAYVTSPQLTARRRREGGTVPTVMPAIDLTPRDVDAIVEFLMTLKDRGTP